MSRGRKDVLSGGFPPQPPTMLYLVEHDQWRLPGRALRPDSRVRKGGPPAIVDIGIVSIVRRRCSRIVLCSSILEG